MPRESVYIETSIVSYLTARPSRDLVLVACQEMTRTWWEERRHLFDLYISERVVSEASHGDADAAARRLSLIKQLAVLQVSENAVLFARELMRTLRLPARASEDAMHIAIAAVEGTDYLLTWNCKHLANATIRRRVSECAIANGFAVPVICTPQELLEELI